MIPFAFSNFSNMKIVLAVVATIALAAVVSAGGYGKGYGGKLVILLYIYIHQFIVFYEQLSVR